MFQLHRSHPVFRTFFLLAFCVVTLAMYAASQAQVCPPQSYQWPVVPGGNVQQQINATFMEAGH